MFVLYNILLLASSIVLVPYYGFKILLMGKYRQSIGPKLGLNPGSVFDEMVGEPRIWIHAVSVGEVTAAAPITVSLRQLYPRACIVLSTSTETGQEMARRLVPEATSHFYYPLDIPWIVRKVTHRVRPNVFVLVETELWPNFIRSCKAMGTRVVIVNGRISPRSFKKYRLTRFFWKKILAMIDVIGVISGVDAERISVMGAASSRIQILGNAKFDSLAARTDADWMKDISEKLGIREGERIFVAGSTHEGEEETVLGVYLRLLERFPDLKLIIVPRNVNRGAEVLALVRKSGIDDLAAMSEIQRGRKPAGERVFVVDVIGELFKVYSLATVVFCGGSLVPRGGQNILEAAAWGKVVFYGPFMDDFRDEKVLLEEAGGGFTVQNGNELYHGIASLLSDPESLAEKGEAGRKAVASNMGASKRYAELIIQCLKSTRTVS